jgi:ATP-binding cassette subfamily B protein
MRRLVAESVRLAWQAGRRELIVMAAMQALTIVLVVAEVLVGRSLVSGLLHAEIANEHVGTLIPEVLGLAGLTAALGIANVIQLNRQRILTELTTRLGEERVLAVTSAVDLAAFDEPGFHDRVERAGQAVLRLPAVVTSLSGMLRALSGAVGAAIGLVALQPLFAVAVLLVLAPTWLAARRRGRVFYEFARRITPRDRERRYLSQILTDRDAAKEVRAFGLADFLGARRGQLWDERVEELRKVADRHVAYTVVADLVAAAIISGTLLVLIALTLSHDISLASAGVTAATIVLLGQRVAVAASNTGALSESALFFDDYLSLVASVPPGEPGPAPTGAEPKPPVRVRVEDVEFSYAGGRAAALRGVSLEIAPGEVVALVGENGSGKTTLAKLLAGLYSPGAGRVTLDGEDATGHLDELRRNVAVIFQDFMRYSLPVRENIGLGRHERLPDDEGVRRAAGVAGAHAAIERLPDGYNTMLGPAFAGGTDLSLGQWQRMALARALFREAPFVILDEPTAALDAQAEHDLFAGIRMLLAGRSVLLISHRFSSVREADRIHVMHEGVIVESGTHDELVVLGGRYARMFELQAAPYR